MTPLQNPQRVVIVGASDNPDRYAYKALKALQSHGHTVVPVHPKLETIEGVPVVADLTDVQGKVETVTLYVGPAISSGLTQKLIQLRPGRIIFNPGTENPALEADLQVAGIPTEHACTLVLLGTGQF